MIKNFLITGDCHGLITERLEIIKNNMSKFIPEETALIILGDSGINYHLNGRDKKNKKRISTYGYTLYLVRGNHEQRPEELNYPIEWDNEVNGYIYIDPEFPQIKYLMDGGRYKFGEYTALVIGGAYSVDKYYRLQRGYQWFEREQLDEDERDDISDIVANLDYPIDFVFTHTCPISWEPTDLFLSMIDQSTVDKTMENWLDSLKDEFIWGVWCFAHFHSDRLERPYVEMFYKNIESLEDIWNRWQNYKKTNSLDYWLRKSPQFYMT